MASEEGVKVYGFWASPFSKRVEIALNLKGIEYEYLEEDLSNKSPQLLKYNPIHKKIPVLLHHGKPVVESLLILEYIDETWKHNNPSLVPSDPYHASAARLWAKFIDDKVMVLLREIYGGAPKLEEAIENLQFLEKEIKGKRFFGGDTLGLVDIAGIIIAFWMPMFQDAGAVEIFTEDRFPLLWKWSKELVNVEAVKQKLPPRDKAVAYFKARFGWGK